MKEGTDGGVTFRLEHPDGRAADPPTLQTAVPNWRPGDTIPLRRDRVLRVVGTRPGAEPEGDPVLVVEDDAAEGDAA
jgi:hypothetical protein